MPGIVVESLYNSYSLISMTLLVAVGGKASLIALIASVWALVTLKLLGHNWHKFSTHIRGGGMLFSGLVCPSSLHCSQRRSAEEGHVIKRVG